MLKHLYGDDALKKVVLATTMWDVEEEGAAIRREQQLLEKQEYWGYMASKVFTFIIHALPSAASCSFFIIASISLSHGSKSFRHDNTKQSALKLVATLQ
jgi:hypothetical protein